MLIGCRHLAIGMLQFKRFDQIFFLSFLQHLSKSHPPTFNLTWPLLTTPCRVFRGFPPSSCNHKQTKCCIQMYAFTHAHTLIHIYQVITGNYNTHNFWHLAFLTQPLIEILSSDSNSFFNSCLIFYDADTQFIQPFSSQMLIHFVLGFITVILH